MGHNRIEQISCSAVVGFEELGRIASLGAARAMQDVSYSFERRLEARGVCERTGSNFHGPEMRFNKSAIAAGPEENSSGNAARAEAV